MRLRRLIGVLVTLSALACHSQPRSSTNQRPVTPINLRGTYEDDYGSSHRVTATEWQQDASIRYEIREWHADSLYLIAQNATSNPSDGGLWTRIDWMRLEGAPYAWAFCLSAYKAPSAAIARATVVAQRATPKTGCNGYPFTRLKPVSTR